MLTYTGGSGSCAAVPAAVTVEPTFTG